MLFSVLLCFTIVYLISQCCAHSAEEPRYEHLAHGRDYKRGYPLAKECGAHGKFEYCIDGIPGCVIGCHCHPGYYFDTDTKICEPNTKLTEDFRRRYLAEPTRVYTGPTPGLLQTVPTQTTTNALYEKNDDVTKDNDELGDWLYNQFFRTIESQVINSTHDDQALTRRNGGDDVFRASGRVNDGGRRKNTRSERKKMRDDPRNKNDKNQRRTRKSSRGRGKKSKKKTHGLRRKLLRITEDDSLFDSESQSDSGSDSSASRSSESESDSDETSKEKDDKDHGHKKVLIFNKRPRPPLPSFIFLPNNMDTPFYPPIGLPPPPIMPMYPMVPIPPMAPFLPFIGHQSECKNTSTTTPASTTEAETSHATTEIETSPTTPMTTSSPTTEISEDKGTEDRLRSGTRGRSKIHKGRKPPPIMKESEEEFLLRSRDLESRFKQNEHLKWMQKLRAKWDMKNKLPGDIDDPMEDPALLNGIPNLQDPSLLHAPPSNKPKYTKQKENEKDKKPKDVNFKYISELIHRAKLNNTTSPSDTKVIPKHLDKTRRTNLEFSSTEYKDEFIITTDTAFTQDLDDKYFSKLGRQIATLIRNIDVNNNITPEENNNHQASILSILHENGHSPRSYWDRSVRSPLAKLKIYLEQQNYPKQSNEKNLYSLENEVNTFVSTTPSPSLQELENILSAMHKAQDEMRQTGKLIRQSNASFNVNLLPTRSEIVENIHKRIHVPLENFRRTIESPRVLNNQNVDTNNVTYHLDTNNIDSQLIDSPQYHYKGVKTKLKPHNHNIKTNTKSSPTNDDRSSKNIKENYLKFLKRLTLLTPTTENVNSQEMGTKYAKLYAKHPELLEKHPELLAKHPELLAKYADLLEQHSQASGNYPEPLVNVNAKSPKQRTKYHELHTKYSKLPVKHRKLHVKYTEVPGVYPIIHGKHNPRPIVNYKSLNYFTGNRQHYVFQVHPLHLPNAKRISYSPIETNKPSYFHDELHHYDYFD